MAAYHDEQYDAFPPRDDLRKRFWLFVADRYYPAGGMRDFSGAFDSIKEAVATLPRSKALKRDVDRHVLDTRTKRITEV